MIGNARGSHSSPGIYMKEVELSYAAKSLGITTLGVVGETLKGPAFEPIRIENWGEFVNYFGGTSTEKFEGTGYPKYELPYIAKSYLKNSNQLEVCRVLGLSGYNAGPAWVLTVHKENGADTKKYVVAVLRANGTYTVDPQDANCGGDANYDVITWKTDAVGLTEYENFELALNNCGGNESKQDSSKVTRGKYGKFGIKVGDNLVYSVSLNPADKDYIINVLGTKPNGNYPIFVEELYDVAYMNMVDSLNEGDEMILEIGNIIEEFSDYKEEYRCASTPWIVSELKGDKKNVIVEDLFRFHTISDGECANTEVKVSIQNIKPDEGLFDVVIRKFDDMDGNPIVLERFNKCNMIPGTSNFIGLKIGTFDGEYVVKSKYVVVEVNANEKTEGCVPAGFKGYPMRDFQDLTNPDMGYNLEYNDDIREKKQYFGFSNLKGIDVDIFKYKGKKCYADGTVSKGFHLDARIKDVETMKDLYQVVTTTEGTTKPLISDEIKMTGSIYENVNLRKFTVCFYGGFDGWDPYRSERTNGDKFKANKYEGVVGEEKTFSEIIDSEKFNLTGRCITSDYYAYLAGARQFSNIEAVDINLFATPGIDYVNQPMLSKEILSMIEEERGDSLYVMTTPDKDTTGEMLYPGEVVANLESAEIDSNYAATYYPWVKYFDKDNNVYINLPATKDALASMAYTDNISYPWFAPAGTVRGAVDCERAAFITKLEDEDMLYEGCINPIKTFAVDGVKIWGQKTMYTNDTPLNRINVRRLMLRVKKLIQGACRRLIFEQNDATVKGQFEGLVRPILDDIKSKRGIYDYRLTVDDSPEARDRQELPASIMIKPTKALEYIDITFTIMPESVSFDE